VDHVHLLFSYYPQVQLSKFVNNLKTVTSRMIRKEFASEVAIFYDNKPELWTKSYFLASSGGVTVETWRRYVQNQNPPTVSKKRLSNKRVSNPRD
jgi:putative transposase